MRSSTWQNVLSLMTLAELAQRRVGHAIAFLEPTEQAIREWAAEPSPDSPLWTSSCL